MIKIFFRLIEGLWMNAKEFKSKQENRKQRWIERRCKGEEVKKQKIIEEVKWCDEISFSLFSTHEKQSKSRLKMSMM